MRSQRWRVMFVGVVFIVSISGCGSPAVPVSQATDSAASDPVVTQPVPTVQQQVPTDIDQTMPDGALPASEAMTSQQQSYVSSMQQQARDFWAADACHYLTNSAGVTTGDVCLRRSNIDGVYYVTTYDPASSDHSGVILIDVNMNAAPEWFMYRDYSRSPLAWVAVRSTDPAPSAATVYYYVTVNGRTAWYLGTEFHFLPSTNGMLAPAWDPAVTTFSWATYAQINKTMQQIPGSSY